MVGDNVLSQINAISFTKPLSEADPLPQVLTVASTGTRLNFTTRWWTATGGNWLSVSGLGCGGGNGGCGATPQVLTAIVNANPTLPAGTYTGQIVVDTGSMSITVPVNLTVAQQGAPFFDNIPGQISFSLQTGSGNPPNQSVQLRNGGSGTLNWTLTSSTSDGGNWLDASPSSGTAPSTVSVGILANALPSGGLVAGTFTGELVFRTGVGSVTVPVSVVVGTSVFVQLGSLSFTKPFGGADPLPQTLNIASTGARVNFTCPLVDGHRRQLVVGFWLRLWRWQWWLRSDAGSAHGSCACQPDFGGWDLYRPDCRQCGLHGDDYSDHSHRRDWFGWLWDQRQSRRLP